MSVKDINSIYNYDSLRASLRNHQALSREDEIAFFADYIISGSQDSLTRIIHDQGRTVIAISEEFRRSQVPMDDLVQEGFLAILKAIKRYDPDSGYRISTFMSSHVRYAMMEMVRNNYSIVKLITTKPQRKLFHKIYAIKNGKESLTAHQVTQVSKEYGVSEDVVRSIDERTNSRYAPYDSTEEYDSDNVGKLILMDENSSVLDILLEEEQNMKDEEVFEIIGRLDERTRDILQSRYVTDEKTPMRELAEKYGISIERVRQIEAKAIDKIRLSVSSE